MRTSLFFACLSAIAGVAQAQPRSNNMNADMDYSVPTPNRPDLVPYASFGVQWQIHMQNGHHILSFDLPAEIQAGNPTTIELRDTNPNAQRGQTAHFQGQNGYADCNGGDWDNVKCDMHFQNLPPFNKPMSDQFLDNEFGPGSPQGTATKSVAEIFGYEPIGVVQKHDDCSDCDVGNGTWSVRFFNGQWIDASMTLNGHSGSYQSGSSLGSITDIDYNGMLASGHWSMGGQNGWFRFQFQNSGSFTGDWGYGQNVGQNSRGQWNGQRH